MKFKFWGVIGIAIFLLACEKDQIIEEGVNLEATLVDETLIQTLYVDGDHWNTIPYKKALKRHQVTKKLKVRTSGTMVMIPNSDECDGFIKLEVEGEGNATHLGLFNLALNYCTDGENPLGPILATQTAANGDELYSVVVGSNPSVSSLDFLYYGGTGRFEDASGSITLFFTFDYANQTFSNYGDGTITY